MGEELETTGIDPSSEEMDLTEEDFDVDALGAYAEGFEGNLDVEEDDKDIQPEVAAEENPPVEPEEGLPEKEDPEPVVDEATEKITNLEKHVADLNRALHLERKAKKELKAQKEDKPETAISPDQLKKLFKEHADDTDTLFDLVNYMVEQGTVKGKEAAVDATELSRRKQVHDNFVYNAWPELAKDDSELRTQADTVKGTLGIEAHPMGDYLAMGAILVDQLPNIQKESYEKGKADALKEKANSQRKKTIKDNSLTSSGNAIKPTDGSGGATPTQRETMDRLDMNPAQRKIYLRLMKKGNK